MTASPPTLPLTTLTHTHAHAPARRRHPHTRDSGSPLAPLGTSSLTPVYTSLGILRNSCTETIRARTQSIPVYTSPYQFLPVYTSLTGSTSQRARPPFSHTTPNAVKHRLPPAQNNGTARAARPRNRGNVFLHAPAAPSGAAAPLHRRASGWRAVLPRDTHDVFLRLEFFSNAPSRSDRIIDRGVGVAATRQRSRFPTRRAFQCVHPPKVLPLAVGLRAPQPEAPPIRLCALIDGPLSVFGHAVRGDTTPTAAGAFSGYRRSAAG